MDFEPRTGVMAKVFVVVALVWLALIPPFFTGGACTAEFDAEASRIEKDGGRLRTVASAVEYLRGRGVAHAVVPVDECRRAKPRWLQSCGGGPIIHAKVPVNNPICRVYRDDEIRVRLFYDERDRLSRTQVDMDPFKSLPLVGGITLHWGR
ncbi:MAG: hypothetical protein ACXWHA_13155 [Usitatibacter sp.]